jgi:hypothetical protein
MNKLKMTQTLNKWKFKVMKNSPEILMYAGIVGVVGAGVLACKSTLKLSEVLDRSKETIKTIHETVEDESVEDYSKDDAKKDLTIVYASTALDIAKLYAPSVLLGGLSIAAMIQSHNVLNKRNAALAAAFTTATESFDRYRKSVVDRYGERVDYELRHGIKTEKIEVTETDENGKIKKKKEIVDVASEINIVSDYARYFDNSNPYWEKDPEYNLMFLKAQQAHANNKLIAQGYLFLNEVYSMIGIEPSKAGQIVGWIYDKENPDGDNYVDFGIYETMVQGYVDDHHNDTIGEERRDFVNGLIPSILLDFNVDGNIWEKM